jgi:hypothetical protein
MKTYKTIEDIDDEFGMELGMDGDPVQFEYEAGAISPEIAKANEERRLLTMIDGAGDGVAFVIGLAWVNRIAYYATEKPMPEALYNSRLIVEG